MNELKYVYRLLGTGPLSDRISQETWHFEAHEVEEFYRVWEDVEESGMTVYVYVRGEDGRWVES